MLSDLFRVPPARCASVASYTQQLHGRPQATSCSYETKHAQLPHKRRPLVVHVNTYRDESYASMCRTRSLLNLTLYFLFPG